MTAKKAEKYTATVPLISGGRITISESIRNKLGLKDGDLVQLIISLPDA